MTISDWLHQAITQLDKASVPTPRLDAEVLLTDALQKNRAWLLAHPDSPLQGRTLQKLDEWVLRRTQHEPIAYIRGKQEFYGREFVVSPETLTPRPETETLVELALDIMKSENIDTIIDVGTGSGCIVISIALEARTLFPSKRTKYFGLDISSSALSVAKQNAKNHDVVVEFEQYDLTKDSFAKFIESNSKTVVVANLPYVPNNFKINLAATHEPEFAIYGGEDGLKYYKYLFEKVGNAQFILTESLPPQHKLLEKIAVAKGYDCVTKTDLIQVFSKK